MEAVMKNNMIKPHTIRQCREVAIVESFRQESMYGQSAKKSGCCEQVAILDRGGHKIMEV